MSHTLPARRFALLLLVLVAGSLSATELWTGSWRTDADQAWQSAQQEQRPMILFISSQDCLYCRKMEHETFSNQTVAAAIQAKFVPVSVQAEQNPALVSKFRVRSFPTTVIISPKSGVVDYMVGYVGPNDFQRRLDTAVRQSNSTATASRRRATR